MPPAGKLDAAAANRRASGGSDELNRLRRGEITLDDYLDFRADESVRILAGRVPAERLRMIRDMNRALLAEDPVLVAQIERLTGLKPQGHS
jgi:hypothetical protein